MNATSKNSNGKPSGSQPEEVLREWRESAHYWQKHFGTIRTMFQPLTQALIEELGLIGGEAVLDVAGHMRLRKQYWITFRITT